MANFNHNNDEPSLGYPLAISLLLGTWLLLGLGVQGIFQIIVPQADQPAYLRKAQ